MIGEKKMKKICSLFLVLCLIFSLSACSDNDNSSQNTDNDATQNNNNDVDSTDAPSTPTHTHNYLGATCTEPAKCFCGAIEGKALGHKWNSPSCGQLKECTICGFTEGLEAEHNYITTISKNATCSNEGEKTIKCEICSHKYTENIERIAHNFVKGRCANCKEFMDFYTTGEVVLDEFAGVKFYYLGIQSGRFIKIRVENTNDVPVLVQARNGSVNGNKYVSAVLSEDIVPKQTKEVQLSPYITFNDYGYDSIDSVEFNFFVGKGGFSNITEHITSEKTIKLYPYE